MITVHFKSPYGVQLVESSLETLENKIKSLDHEEAYQILKDGRIVGPFIGNKSDVIGHIKKEDIGKVDTLLHNHPEGVTFSREDILDLATIRANKSIVVTPIRKRYTFYSPSAGWNKSNTKTLFSQISFEPQKLVDALNSLGIDVRYVED